MGDDLREEAVLPDLVVEVGAEALRRLLVSAGSEGSPATGSPHEHLDKARQAHEHSLGIGFNVSATSVVPH
ncbi:hypothetical protein F9278_25205 [Streptomyces phaeolivaceus]|uniref:Uncharacterized protein n=1 Tax=Streptomyces phaeolivaceus TaxID=2653200 RepID=A0A5P8K7C8_9ACTN|nr:hypothetical protein [Streptomyces phaeolivaceus]QFQ98906.1 hypothetical protein F9278_25205 [Streptomyces phaeolivaceus]